MSHVIAFAPCPRCRAAGRDRRGDNLGVYADGGYHCFAGCGYHKNAARVTRKETQNVNEDKAVLPSDFTREVPAAGWKWLLQYGLSYSYWQPYCGYSPSFERLVLTYGNPTILSVGRYIGTDAGQRKWRNWGDKTKRVELLGGVHATSPVILVEDLISAHKVAQFARAIPLFGTSVHDKVLQALIALNSPTVLWLDEDQYTLLPKKINRLQTFLEHPVRFIRSRKDPKEYSVNEIKEILA